jgi:hypothetical protein
MRHLETLEARETPAAFVGGGNVRLDSGVLVHPFEETWVGFLNVTQDDRAVYVGAGPGGGPRGAGRDRATRVGGAADRFFGDPDSRFGLVVIPPDQILPPGETVGEGYAVYLEGAPARTVRDTAKHLTPVLGVLRVTNEYPAGEPFLRVQFGVSIDGPPVGQGGKGYAWVEYPADSPAADEIAAHEIAHAFGVGHNAVPGSLMHPTVGGPNPYLLPDEVATIREELT